jgi:mono/diheme cytochrome c family protein
MPPSLRILGALLALVVAAAAAAAQSAPASAAAAPLAAEDPAVDLFARKCGSCHTVGKGQRVGPDLKGVLGRRDRTWVEKMVSTPGAMLDSDATARQLVAQFGGVRMPDLGLTAGEVRTLVDLVERCSAQPCDLAGKFVPVTTASAADMARGRDLFTGRLALKGGGPPCLSCHAARGSGASIAGGTLARDLTNAFGRLGDQGINATLKAPAFPVMNRAFAAQPLQPEEAFALRAFLYDVNRTDAPPDDVLSLPLAAVLGTIAVLILLNAAWARRLRGVRIPLTHPKGDPR